MTTFPSAADWYMLALCLWREARGEGRAGMAAVGCVVRNRFHRDRTSYRAEVERRLQFSSLTAVGDPELTLWPTDADADFALAGEIAEAVIDGAQLDPTGGATLYYAVTIPFPATWDKAKCWFTVQIGKHRFYRETPPQAQS